MKPFYITTPIYYVNGAPHLGHAYTTLVADSFARYYRQAGRDVFFLTGTDEHGLKIQREAEKQGISPKQMADENSAKFRALFDQLEISYDSFIRTTDEKHKKTVLQMVERMLANGDIYLDKYSGWYSASDEAFYDESEIEDGKAKASGSLVEWVEEESYFFRLSQYQEKLQDWYTQNPNCVKPDVRMNEVSSFVNGGLNDLSISRTTFEWGIPWPNDPKHVLYVWVDALTNYVSAIDVFQNSATFDKYWPCDVHLLGKDILRFHAVYWPAFLMSAGLPLPKEIFAHGWWTVEGEKMSKSKGNFLDAHELAQKFELDSLRYYLFEAVSLGNDGNFSETKLIEKNNSELADNVGNLVNRTFKMVTSFLDAKVPIYRETEDALDIQLRASANEMVQAFETFFGNRQLHLVVEKWRNFSTELNQYIHQTAPWSLNKKGNHKRLEEVLYHALEGIRFLATLGYSLVPHASLSIAKGLELTLPDLTIKSLVWGQLKAGTTVTQPEILFQKLELPEVIAEPVSKKTPKEIPKENKNKKDNGMIDFNDFMKVSLQVAKILTAEKVEGSDKLLKLSIDLGEETPRTVAAGIGTTFSPEEIVGWHVATVTNLEPRKIFGIPSQAMLLAVENANGKLELTRYSETVAPGTKVG